MNRGPVVLLCAALALTGAGLPAGAENVAPVWSSPLALGPTDVTSIAARDGLVVAGGRRHEKATFGGGTAVVEMAPRVAGIFRSTDQGRTWARGSERVTKPNGTVELVTIEATPTLVAVPAAGADAYAFFGSDVWRSDDSAITWTKVGTVAGTPTAVEFLTDGRLAVGLGTGGIRVTPDRGATWNALGTGLPASRVNQMLAYSATLFLVATDTGVYRSTDGGQTFTQATTGLAQPSSAALGVAGFGSSALYLAMPGTALTSTMIYTSSDGATWQPRVPVHSQNLLPRVANGALEVVVQSSLYILYAGTSVGLHRSGTRSAPGAEWERIEPEPGATSVGTMAFEDIDPGALRNHALYAAVRRSSPAVVLRNETRLAAPGWMDEMEGGRICGGLVSRKDGALFAACGRHVLRSNDGGATWLGAGAGLPYVSIGIGDTPYNPLVASADGSLWTSGFHYGLYHSNANVTSWSKVPFPGASVGAIGTHPTDANTVFAAGLLTNGATGVLYRSTDGGLTWGTPVLDLGTAIYNIDVSPKAPSKVLVAAYNRGAWVSENGGTTWTQSTGLSGNVYRAHFSPADASRAWALTSDGVYRSDDAGRSFTFVGTVTVDGASKSTFEIAVSPWDADTIYVLPIDGDLLVTRDGGATYQRLDAGLPKDPCSICEEISNLAADQSKSGVLWITAGVLGASVEPQSNWVYRGVDAGA